MREYQRVLLCAASDHITSLHTLPHLTISPPYLNIASRYHLHTLPHLTLPHCTIISHTHNTSHNTYHNTNTSQHKHTRQNTTHHTSHITTQTSCWRFSPWHTPCTECFCAARALGTERVSTGSALRCVCVALNPVRQYTHAFLATLLHTESGSRHRNTYCHGGTASRNLAIETFCS